MHLNTIRVKIFPEADGRVILCTFPSVALAFVEQDYNSSSPVFRDYFCLAGQALCIT